MKKAILLLSGISLVIFGYPGIWPFDSPINLLFGFVGGTLIGGFICITFLSGK